LAIGQGASADIVQVPLARFTLVGATTREGLLAGPFHDRFGIRLHLDYYTPEEIQIAIRRNGEGQKIEIEEEAERELARRSRGTMPVQLAGNIKYGGLFECAFGVTLGELVNDIGGGTASGRAVRAVQAGGPLGAYFPTSLFDTPYDYEEFAKRDGLIGHGGLVVFDDTANMAAMARFAMEFCALESCGKCTPCRIGAVRGAETFDKIAAGVEPEKNMALVRDLCETMKFGSLCALGGFTPYPVLSALNHFPEDFVPAPVRRAAE
jgi:formate dehydrogenase iron-sulfur subunit